MKKYIYDIPMKGNLRIEIYANNEEEAIEELYKYDEHNVMEDEEIVDMEYDVDNYDIWSIKEDKYV